MSQMPPRQDLPEDADERYRRASALDTSRPGESTREAILAYAQRVADERSRANRAASAAAVPSSLRLRLTSRRTATFGALALAALAGLTLLNRWPAVPFTPAARHPSVTSDLSRAAMSAERPASQPTAQSRAPASTPTLSGRAGAEGRDPGTSYRALAEASRVPAQRPAAPGNDGSVVGGSEARSSRQAAMGAAPASRAPLAGTDQEAELRTAAGRGDIATLRRLIGTNMALNGRDRQGQTALMQAVRHGESAAAARLLVAGADANAPDNEGVTPLAAAEAAAQSSMVQLLRRYGAR